MKKFISLCALIMSFGASASCDRAVSSIADEAVKNVTLIACMKAEQEVVDSNEAFVDSAKEVLGQPDKLEELAHSYSSAIGIMANELGVAANEFIKTDAGRLAVVAIVYTVFGDDFKGFVFTPLICIIILFMWKKFNQINLRDSDGKMPSFSEMSDGEAAWFVISSVVTFIFVAYVLVNGWL